MSDSETPLDGLGYEEAREQLLEVVRTLERGGTTLEESLALWERGEALARVCEQWLHGAQERLDAAIGKDAAETHDD
jgi:exodeoxyribonuclease VII small subunit